MISPLRPSEFSMRLERYLDDYRKGRARPSDSIPSELRTISYSSSETLARSNPRLSSLANLYSTGLSYDKYARFTSAVGFASDTLKTLNEISAQKSNAIGAEVDVVA